MRKGLPVSDLERFVVFRDGYCAPVEALRLAWRLEDQGFRFRLDGDGCLMVGPSEKLSPADVAALRQWSRHLEAMLAHFEAHDLAAHLVATPRPPVPRRHSA
jgi:hypothetical protein